MIWLRRIFVGILVLLALAAAGYYWEFVDSRVPEGSYALDMAEIRRLADSIAGDKPVEVRVEKTFTFNFPLTAMVAGAGWQSVDVPVYAYQVAYSDRFLIIDTGMNAARVLTDKNFDPKALDAAAQGRVNQAMVAATNVVITHEHPDHIGGLTAHPELAAVLPHTQLTEEQLAHPEKMGGEVFPKNALAAYRPLSYSAYFALAPGVVLVKAPGHTPGSQMVFVKRADGMEYLFLGDVAWRFENVERTVTRARFVSDYFLEEDRAEVLRQLAALHELHKSEPNLIIVPGHDGEQMSGLLKRGVVTAGFK